MQEIVIKINDIPKNDHERWVKSHGTPLPKGHGRLIDADVITEKMGNLDGFGFIGKCINEIPTVLEVDKDGDTDASN